MRRRVPWLGPWTTYSVDSGDRCSAKCASSLVQVSSASAGSLQVTAEGDSRDVRVGELLDQDRDARQPVDASLPPIRDGTLGRDRSPASEHRIDDRVDAPDVEDRLVLARERSVARPSSPMAEERTATAIGR